MDKRHNLYLELGATIYGEECLKTLLDERTLQILYDYFGKGETLETIGASLSISRSRVRQIKQKGVWIIRRAFNSYKKREMELQELRKENRFLYGRIHFLEAQLKEQRAERIEQTEYEWSKIPVVSLDVTVRTLNCLRSIGFNRATLGDLSAKVIQESEQGKNYAVGYFLGSRSFGRRSLVDLIEGLEKAGVPEHIVDLLR